MKFTKKILKNGLRVLTVPMGENPAVTVLVLVEAGSRYETKEINGISHFLEHMVFKGTPTRPNASDISRELDSLGSEYNAFTSDEYTGYYAKVDKKHLDKALDIVSDMYLNPLFKEEEIEKEKGVIIEEIRMYNDLPQRKVHDVIGSLMYGDQPAGWTVLGSEKNIKSFTREHFIDYRKKHYVAKATTIIVSGNIEEEEVIKKIEKVWSNIPNEEKHPKLKVVESQKKPEIEVVYKDTDQTHIAIGIRTFSTFDKRKPTMKVLSGVLGKGMSSRLFSKMRDKLGICYYIRASHITYTDHGYLCIPAGIDTSRIKIGIENIIEEISRLREELVSSEELQKAKDYLSGTLMLGLETSDSQAEYIGDQEIIKGEIKLPEKVIEEIQSVTKEDIRNLAREIFVDNNLNMAIVGPFKNKEEFIPFLTLDKTSKK